MTNLETINFMSKNRKLLSQANNLTVLNGKIRATFQKKILAMSKTLKEAGASVAIVKTKISATGANKTFKIIATTDNVTFDKFDAINAYTNFEKFKRENSIDDCRYETLAGCKEIALTKALKDYDVVLTTEY